MATNGPQLLLSPNMPMGSNNLPSANFTKAINLNKGKVASHLWMDSGMKRVSEFETCVHTHRHTHNSGVPPFHESLIKYLICKKNSCKLNWEKYPRFTDAIFFFLPFSLCSH